MSKVYDALIDDFHFTEYKYNAPITYFDNWADLQPLLSNNNGDKPMKKFIVPVSAASTYDTYELAEADAKRKTASNDAAYGIYQLIAKTKEIVPDIQVEKVPA